MLYYKLDNTKGYATSVLLGVPQGTVLAPLLMFLIDINDLPTSCVRNKVRMYADDVLILILTPKKTVFLYKKI